MTRVDDRSSGAEAIASLRESLGIEWRILQGLRKERNEAAAVYDEREPYTGHRPHEYEIWESRLRNARRSASEAGARCMLLVYILRRARSSNLEWY